jgi:hypothetical protein
MSRQTRQNTPSALLAAIAALTCASGAVAQSRPAATISVGPFSTEKRCTLYQESAGKAAFVATDYGVAAAASWRTWLVKDCVDNFASMRTSLEAALASTGKFTVTGKGAPYTVTGRISDVSGDDGAPAPNVPTPEGAYSVASRFMSVNADITVKDTAGRIIYGGVFTKRLETASAIKTDAINTSSTMSGQALYTQLQHEIALTAARLVAFHFAPLKVIGGDGREIQLNYGAPLLKLGTALEITSPDGGVTARYNVVSATATTATATIDGDGDTVRIVPGSTGQVLEADDPASNGRRLKRVDLP